MAVNGALERTSFGIPSLATEFGLSAEKVHRTGIQTKCPGCHANWQHHDARRVKSKIHITRAGPHSQQRNLRAIDFSGSEVSHDTI
jgi:hypothetical protein